MSELKPCPFCGGKAYMKDNGNGHYSVACQDCFIETGNEKGKCKAIKEWNTRYTPQTELTKKAEKKKPGVAITHSKELLNLIQMNCTDQIKVIRANYTAKGVEAVVKDKFDDKIYILKIEGKNE